MYAYILRAGIMLTWGMGLYLGLATFPSPLNAQDPIKIEISPNVPFDLPALSDGTDRNTLQQAAVFAWQQFIGVTWPAKNQDGSSNTRDEPDTSGALKYGDKGPSGHVVWETYRHKAEILPGQGTPNGYDPTKPDFGYDALPQYVYQNGEIAPAAGVSVPLVPPYNNLDETDEIFLCDMNAGIGRPHERVLYQAKANRVLYKYIAENRLFEQTFDEPGVMRANAVFNLTQDDPAAFKRPFLELPSSDPASGTRGTIEIKSAWRRLNTDTTSSHFDDPRRFYTSRVRYYVDENVGTPNEKRTYRDSKEDEIWGLIALHVIQKTASSPAFIYTTFGQIDNIRAANGDLVEEPDGTVKPQFLVTEPFVPPLVITESKAPENGGDATPQEVRAQAGAYDTELPQIYYRNKPPFTHGVTQPVGVNRRLFSIPPSVAAVNKAAQEAIRQHNAESVWQFYKLVNVQSQRLESFVDRAEVPSLSADLKSSYYLANIVVETNVPLQQFSGMLSPPDGLVPGYEKAGNSDFALFDRPGAFDADGFISFPFSKNQPVANTFVKRSPQGSGTYWRGVNMGGCLGCHGGQGQLVGGDFSVVVARGRVVSPEAPELPEDDEATLVEAGTGQNIQELNKRIRSQNQATIRNSAILYGQ